jgi:hypothetical protein
MTDAVHQPQKESYVLVTFTYNDSVERYTNWGDDVLEFLSVPGFSVKLPKNAGVMEKALCQITMPINDTTTAFLSPLSTGLPFANIRVEIQEFIRSSIAGETSQNLILFDGWVLRTTKNPNNRPGYVRLEARSPKSNLDKPMGVSCDHECPWTLYEFPCTQGAVGPQKADERKLVTLSSISGKTITVSGDAGLAGSKSYRDGYVERLGARVRVRAWDSGTPNTLHLNRQLPESWLSQQLILVPGCDHSQEHCDGAWGNLDHFGGIGFAIPAHNPIIENPLGGVS